MNFTATTRDPSLPPPLPPQPELFSLYEEEPGGTRPDRLFEVRPQERDQRQSTARWSCRRLTFLSRRGRTSWWRCAGTWTCRCPNRLLMCPRSHLHPVVLAGAGFPWCRRRNSWWKCLLSYPFLLCTVPHGRGLQGSLPGQTSTTSSSHSLGVADEAFTWFFALFPKF